MNQRNLIRHLSQLLCLTSGLAALTAHADVKLPVIFSDHMVLQRDQKVPVWGWADEGEKVTVEFAGQKVDATAQGGKWTVSLAPLKASSTGAKFTVSGKNKVEFSDVLVGEVWFCSGQSNMEWSVAASKNAKEEIAAANNPRIRHFKVPHVTATEPQTEVKTSGGWQLTATNTVGGFTAVGYYFAREIQKELDVPIGLIGCNWGGTRIEPWTPPVGFQSVPALKADFADKLDTFPARSPAKTKEGKEILDKDGKPVLNVSSSSPLSIYNAMVHPIIPYAIKGALWYQGESNNGEGMLYFEKKKALITGWRKLWNQGEFPFLFVQLAPYRYNSPEKLPGIWEAQAATLSIPNTGMAVTTDVSTVGNIHPPDKQTVAHRLALWALAKTYNKPVTSYASPLFDTLKVEGNKATVSFKNAVGGLKSLDGKPLTWFTIAGEDKKFVEAKAEVNGNSVTVSAEGVAKPAAVRFGWHELAEPNLANAAGLPASPFRSDKWTDATMPVLAPAAPPAKK
ncbi:MAG: sialate O-acetylesterase [Limisphaerales bacterium]